MFFGFAFSYPKNKKNTEREKSINPQKREKKRVKGWQYNFSKALQYQFHQNESNLLLNNSQ